MRVGGHIVEDGRDKDYAAHYDVSDKNDPFSVINMAPRTLRDAIRKIDPELFKMDEMTLRRRVKPDAVLEKLRLNFAEEYARAIMGRRIINLHNVTRNVTYREYFEDVLDDPKRTCWMVRPPADLRLTQRYLLGLVYRTIEEWIAIPPRRRIEETKNGVARVIEEFDPEAAQEMKKLAHWLEVVSNGGLPFPLDREEKQKPLRRTTNRAVVKNLRPSLTDEIVEGSGFDAKDDAPESEHEPLPRVPPEAAADQTEFDEVGGLEPGDFGPEDLAPPADGGGGAEG